MTSTPVAKVSKTKPKKTLKRIMLAAPDEPELRTIDEHADKLIEDKLVNYLKGFNSRDEIRLRIMLGLNSITRCVEACSDNLKAVLLNADVRPQRLIIYLQELCIHKGVPVAAIRGMDKIAGALQGTIKALKTNITAVGILGGCSSEILHHLITALPPAKLRPVEPSPRPSKAKPPAPPPPRPKVNVRELLIEMKDTDATIMDATAGGGGGGDGEPAGSRLTVGHFGSDLVDLSENSTPFVDYSSFIGSSRPLKQLTNEPLDHSAPSTSGYKPPVVKIR